jgi:Transposase IS200 like
MEDYKNLNHSRWQCKYHIVFIPKYRKRKLYGVIKKHLGEAFHRLAEHKECWIEEGHIMPDHVHMLVNVPPETLGIECGGVYQREERNPHSEALSEAGEELRRPGILGEGILRGYSGPRHRTHP